MKNKTLQNEFLRSLGVVTEQLNDAIVVTNLENEITYANQAFQTLYGYSFEEILGRKPDFLNAEPIAKQIQSDIYRTVASGKVWKGEIKNRRKDGSSFDCALTIFALTDEQGNIFAYAGNQRDITERKKIEKLIHEKEERFRGLVEMTSDWIWEVDENTVYTYASSKIRDILGYEPEEILGKTPFDLMPSEEARSISGIFGPIAEAKISFHRLENTNVHKDGHLVVLETSGVPIFSSDGKFSGYRGIDRDITERKEAEKELKQYHDKLEQMVEERTLELQKLRDELLKKIDQQQKTERLLFENTQDWENTFNTITDMITVHDKDFNIIRYNNSAKKILNLPMLTEMPTRIKKENAKCFKYYHGTEAPPEGCPSCDCLQTGEPASFEIYEPHLGKHIEIRAIPRFDEDRNIVGLVHVVRDISQRVEDQRQIEKSREELRRLNAYLQNLREEERTRIAREIHDELGQSLTAMKIEVSWLAKKLDAKDKTMKEKLYEIEAIADSTIRTVQKIAYELRPGVLDDIGLQAALELQLEEFMKHTGIDCDVIVDAEIDSLENQLSTVVFRILQETLTNVARHSEATEVRGFVRLSNGTVSAQIVDNGVGFTEEDMSNKVHLGIAGMKERARQVGGEVTVEGVPGQGTRVSFQIPLKT